MSQEQFKTAQLQHIVYTDSEGRPSFLGITHEERGEPVAVNQDGPTRLVCPVCGGEFQAHRLSSEVIQRKRRKSLLITVPLALVIFSTCLGLAVALYPNARNMAFLWIVALVVTGVWALSIPVWFTQFPSYSLVQIGEPHEEVQQHRVVWS